MAESRVLKLRSAWTATSSCIRPKPRHSLPPPDSRFRLARDCSQLQALRRPPFHRSGVVSGLCRKTLPFAPPRLRTPDVNCGFHSPTGKLIRPECYLRSGADWSVTIRQVVLSIPVQAISLVERNSTASKTIDLAQATPLFDPAPPEARLAHAPTALALRLLLPLPRAPINFSPVQESGDSSRRFCPDPRHGLPRELAEGFSRCGIGLSACSHRARRCVRHIDLTQAPLLHLAGR